MKTKIYLKLSAVLMIIALCIASCAKSPVDDSGGDDTGNGGDGGNDGGGGTAPSTEVVVQLKCTGEIPEMENQSSHLLYIQAYAFQGDYEEEGYYGLKQYAHGLFDKVSDITIPLQKDWKYRFFATIVADGKDRIANNNGVYGLPFKTSLTNTFVFTDEFDSYGITGSEAEIAGSGVFSRPDIDRYYGETGIYTVNPDFPSPVVVSIVRATFGLKVKVNNLTEGKLHIKTEGSPVATISYPETEVSYIFSAMYICSAFYEDAEGKTEFTNEYTERINVNITYENADGLEIPVKQEDYSFSRNEYTNLEVTVSGSAVGSGFEINVEQTKMEDDGREIEFTGGGDYKKN